MKQFKGQNIFKVALSKWYDFNKVHGFSCQFINEINSQIERIFDIQITFDSRYAEAICFLINFSLCLAFKQTERDQIDIKTYLDMAQQLYKQKLISKRHLFDIKSIKPFNIVEKIADVIKHLVQGNITVLEIQQKWPVIFGIAFVEFWKFILRKQIKHTILYELYKITEDAPIMAEQKQLKKYMKQLQKDLHKQLQTQLVNLKISQFKEQYQQILIKQKVDFFHPKQMIAIPINQEKIQQQKVNMNSDIDNNIESQLRSISFKYSLFRNPEHTKNLKKIQLFINFVAQTIFKHKNYTLLTFGSIRSSLALSNQYDIDITFISPDPKNNTRQISINHLWEIKRSLNYQSFNWYKSSRVYSFQDLAMPYLKIQVDEISFEKVFSIQNTTKIDITIGNMSAVMNSDLLSRFAQIPEVHSFCILIKLWAKARNIIKLQQPMRGLSSYMLMLMCIYYLMECGQIDFLQAGEAELENIEKQMILPNLKRVSIKSMLDNFIGFLQFYKQTGRFQRQRKVVCLLKKGVPQGYEFNQNFVVNAYDFIDKSNPGRLKLLWKDQLFFEIERALLLLESKSEYKINLLFDKK